MADELTPEAVRAWAEGLVRGIGSETNVPLARAVLSLFARHEQALGLLRRWVDWYGAPDGETREAINALLAERTPNEGEWHCREGAPPTTVGRLTTMDNDIAALERRMSRAERNFMPTEASSDDRNTPDLNERVAELEAWRSDVDGREQAQLDAIFEPSSQQRATSPLEWRLPTDKPSYDPQDIEHRVLVAEGHAVPFGDGWLLKPHRWYECAPDTSVEMALPRKEM